MQSSKRCNVIWAAAMCLTSIAGANAQVNLNRLTACADIASTAAQLRAQKTAAESSCRRPRSALERAFFSRNGGYPSALCLLREAPASFVEGFSCVQTPELKGTSSITCFRSAVTAEIEQYQKNYTERFAARATQYTKSIKQCPATNGSASFVQATTFPPMLAAIAKLEFGFMSPLGSGRVTDSYVQHGYATTDPSLGDGVPGGIEFVAMLIDGKRPTREARGGDRQKIGKWELTTKRDLNIDEFIKMQRKATGEFIAGAIAAYEIENENATASMPQKVTGLNTISRRVVSVFRENDFDQLSASEFEDRTGKRLSDIVKTFQEATPYGRRSLALRQINAATVVLKEDNTGCTLNGRGAVMAFILTLKPVPDVEPDFGEIVVFLVGVGNCGRGAPARRYLNNLVEDTTEQIADALQTR
jgi:hypothetical protein